MVICNLPHWQWSLVFVVLYFVKLCGLVLMLVFFLHFFGYKNVWIYFVYVACKPNDDKEKSTQ